MNEKVINLVDELELLYKQREHARTSYNEIISKMEIMKQTILIKKKNMGLVETVDKPVNNTKKSGTIDWLKANTVNSENSIPIEQPALKRKADLIEIYGIKNYNLIQKLESEQQNKFDNFCNVYQPKFWPIESLRY